MPSYVENVVSDDQAVYFATGKSEGLPIQLHKVRALDGVELWRVNLELYDELATVTLGADVYLAAPHANYLAAFNKTNGNNVWEKRIELARGEPLVVESRLLVADQEGVNLFDARNGHLVWRSKLAAPRPAWALLAARGDVAVVTTTSGDPSFGSIFALDLRSGREKWRFEDARGTNSIVFDSRHVWFGPPMILGDYAYFASEIKAPDGTGPGNVFGLHLSNGSLVWRIDMEKADLNAYYNYLAGQNGTIYVSSPVGLAAIDGKTGNEIWRLPRHGGGATRSLAIAGGIIYWAAGGGNLLAISAHEGKVTGPTIQVNLDGVSPSVTSPSPFGAELVLVALAVIGIVWRRKGRA